MRRACRGLDFQFSFNFLEYDHIFERYPISYTDTLRAISMLAASGATQLWQKSTSAEGLFDGLNQKARLTAGMVVQWVANNALREELREAVHKEINRWRPDVILGHSLGSLVGYDVLTHPIDRPKFRNAAFVSFGSQIGNPFVVGNFMAGRIEPITDVKWYHLYNRWDDVFTHRIRLFDSSFVEIDTPFGQWLSWGDHNPAEYLAHPQTVERVWPMLLDRDQAEFITLVAEEKQTRREPTTRALLVGINEYPNPRHCLQGPINDVFLMSSVLQENGFSPDHIRLLVNDRATAAGIRERLEWLFHDVQDGDRLVFHFSGHGTALPGYNAQTVVDRIYECLVPYDFNGSISSAVTDEQIYEMYVNLPYAVQVTMILDCCHAGGQARAGAPIRGIDPPEDIRHRAMRWDTERQLWMRRELKPLMGDLTLDSNRMESFAGEDGATLRMGRALPVRRLPTRSSANVAMIVATKVPICLSFYRTAGWMSKRTNTFMAEWPTEHFLLLLAIAYAGHGCVTTSVSDSVRWR
ncbi:caspase family protein [Blastopirellula sp. J2-11]|uniref:caspase family protein n=1 Tax=Blastopirellula sp. J2-11 TaxID=2943192 RepID=UPI0021C825B2|nr:caspase family protein [Blastopirellula sp. J2-11]UUO04980.1 caspase family protein [Blastopirellula sp. J2-11]